MFKATAELPNERWDEAVKTPQNAEPTEIRHFSGMNIPPVATGLWLISRVLEKSILIILGGPVFSIASMKGEF